VPCTPSPPGARLLGRALEVPTSAPAR
jgi:hypothetical protein